MSRRAFISLAILVFIQFSIGIALVPPSLAEEWAVRGKQQGTIRVVDLFLPSTSVNLNYAEGLLTFDKDNNWVPCLAKDWRWVDERTIEFKLREDVRFHNGEKFNAEAVRVNWEAYSALESARPLKIQRLPDETILEVINDYKVRFTLPEPTNLAYLEFMWFFQIAPAFFKEHKFDENNWGFLPEAGPWATGPFRFVEGSLRFGRFSDRIVLEANDDYWDPRYPKVKRVIFDNTLTGNRKEAMRLCREKEGAVDIVNHIRPLDTLKVAESPFAKVVKSRDEMGFAGTINQRKKDSKWRDIRLRRALNYAINRKELWKWGAKGNAYNLEGYPIPPGVYGHNPDLTPYVYDTTKARALLAQAGYPDGFEVKIITREHWKLETQIMKRMLERIGLKVKFDVLTFRESMRKTYIPILDKPPEEQDWDIALGSSGNWFGRTVPALLIYGFLEDSRFRWIEFDPVYEEMWKDIARTLDTKVLEEKIRKMEQYVYDRAYLLFIYSPLSLYAVNKEVNFVPQKLIALRFKETSVTDNHWSVQAGKK